MSKLWIFGDSYGELPHESYRDHPGYKPPYQNQLAEMLDVDELEVWASPGVAASWIYLQFKEQFPKMTKDDYVLVIWTSRHRKWFFKDLPEHSNIYLRDMEKIMHKDEADAVKNYLAYLKNDEADMLEMNAFASATAYAAASLAMPYIGVSGFNEDAPLMFNPYCEVKGSLGNVCFREFGDNTANDLWERCMKVGGYVDRRLNHMSWPSHDIFAKKLYNSFANREVLDLDTEFPVGYWKNEKQYKDYNADTVHLWDVRYDEKGNRLQLAGNNHHPGLNKRNRKFMMSDLRMLPKSGLHR